MRAWLAAGVLGLSGFASLMHEIAWTRILALVLGPTTYAFAATLAAVIGGVAIGSAAGSWMVSRARRPAAWLAIALALAAMTTSYTYSLAGQQIPSLVAVQMASADEPFAQLLRHGLCADRRPDPADRHLPGRGVPAGTGVERRRGRRRRRPLRRGLRDQHHRRRVGLARGRVPLHSAVWSSGRRCRS